MKRILVALVMTTSFFSAAVRSQETPDGLDPTARRHFYSDKTVVVANLDLTQLDKKTLERTLRGAFYESSLSHVRKEVQDVEKLMGTYATYASGLTELKYNRLVVIGIEDGGLKLFGAIYLGKDVNEVGFAAVKLAVGALFPQGDIDRVGDYAVVCQRGVKVPSDKGHSTEAESTILTGFEQPRGSPAISFVLLPVETVKKPLAGLLKNPKDGSDALGKSLGEAAYTGGYLIVGDRPEIQLYARFGSEERATAVKGQHDAYLADSIAKAAEDDAADEKAEARVVAFTTREAMQRRVAKAMEAKAFGRVFMLPLDATDLRDITAAIVDRYYRKVPKLE